MKTYKDSRCIWKYGNPDKVASPDNLSYSEAMRTLFIGEDSGKHTNNYVWAYNVDTKELERILSYLQEQNRLDYLQLMTVMVSHIFLVISSIPVMN